MSKVLFVVASFVNFSGAEATLADYLSRSTDDNYILIIGTNEENCALFSSFVPEDRIFFWKYSEYRNTSLTRFLLMPLEAKRVKRAFQHSDAKRWVDRIRVNAVYLNNTLENVLFHGMFEEYPIISHVHDMVRHLRPAWGLGGARACCKSAAVLAPSDAAARELAQCGVPKEKIHVVYNGLEFQTNPYHCSCDSEVLTVGFIGGVLRRKGFDILVQAVNQLNGKKSSLGIHTVRLLIVTNTEEDDFFRSCMRMISEEIHVELHRKVSHSRISELYKQIDILLVPSRNDPAPLVVAEGISMGCCVIGSRCDGIPEMLWSEELICEKESADDIVKHITVWMGKTYEEQEEIVSKCQRFVQDRFSSEKKCAVVQKLIGDVVKNDP